MSCCSNFALCHIGELRDDLGDRILITHVVDVEIAPINALVEVANEVQVLKLGDDWVLESLHEQVVVSLLHGEGVFGRHGLVLLIFNKFFASQVVLLLPNIALGFLFDNTGVDCALSCSELTLKCLQVELKSILLCSELFGVVSLHLFLLKGATQAELVNFVFGLFDLLVMIGIHLDLAHLCVALLLFKAFLEGLEIDRVLDNHLLERSLLHILLAELRLHILKEST